MKEKVKNEDIPKIMTGFSFINEACNPCEALYDKPNYNCAFKLNVNGKDDLDPILKNMWKLN